MAGHCARRAPMHAMPIIACRQCRKPMQYEKIADLPFFPFCSRKCKLIDLGEWFNEEHRIEGKSVPGEGDSSEPQGDDEKE